MLPAVAVPDLQSQLEVTQRQYSLDRAAEVAGVWLPFALSRKYPKAGTEWCWQWVFPSTELSTDPESGIVRCHHLSDAAMQRGEHRRGGWGAERLEKLLVWRLS